MVIGMKGSGNRIQLLGWELISESKEENIMGIGKMMSQTVMEFSSSRMEATTRVISRMGKNMGKELFTGLKGLFMKDSGKKVKFRVMAGIVIKMAGPILETGRRI